MVRKNEIRDTSSRLYTIPDILHTHTLKQGDIDYYQKKLKAEGYKGDRFQRALSRWIYHRLEKNKEPRFYTKTLDAIRLFEAQKKGKIINLPSHRKKLPSNPPPTEKMSDFDGKRQERNEKLLLDFQKIIKMSKRIEITTVASLLELTLPELMKRLMEWVEQIPFKIDGNMLVVEDLSFFTDTIDDQFEQWSNKEKL
jgi:hypothetical protein